MSTPAGWYPNGDNWETYWDGTAWTEQHRSKEPQLPAPPSPPTATVVDVSQAALLKFTSHIDGKNATVEIWPDRIEWERVGRMGAGSKAALGVMTLGVSLASTGVTRKRETEMIPIRSITSVTSKKGKGLQTVLSIITSGNTIEMRVGHDEADRVRSTLMQLINAR